MPAVYKFAAWWGGQEGSLLLWSWLLSPAIRGGGVHQPAQAPRHDALGADGADGDAGVLPDAERLRRAARSKCWRWARASRRWPDGNGLNPLLQYWTMAIHPPMLYLGYVGFIVPFAFAMAR
jgi:cytochrome c-type biogenesis protein CcmF